MVEQNESWRTECQDAGDGSGDMIIELPPVLLAALGWTLGDELIVERNEDGISLKLKETLR
ncbi:AbrB/MazE/SpoVT family DNA-binding domain-containing protein [Pseudomonas stutzeri]|nr:AbrB/MazE/SpoVT family DNA-binding domain-containing protein [Stutzerimonas stutzeri]MCQ4313703.1 AbrB/MazE/SpoVT family DNA-binding domain-containing protein [Stutzerimonas stutzeri]